MAIRRCSPGNWVRGEKSLLSRGPQIWDHFPDPLRPISKFQRKDFDLSKGFVVFLVISTWQFCGFITLCFYCNRKPKRRCTFFIMVHMYSRKLLRYLSGLKGRNLFIKTVIPPSLWVDTRCADSWLFQPHPWAYLACLPGHLLEKYMFLVR